MESSKVNCPNCNQPFNPFFMWAKQVRLNRFQCGNCGSFSEFKGGKAPLWLNLLAFLVFLAIGWLGIKFTGSWLGMLLPAFIFLPVGFGVHLYFCKNKKIVAVTK
ncbi:hypothetical protein [Thalassotalea agarivorans]|uniref:Cxxc_20_cxxc protein n=1 Tax=Thalassotalea agarivorans TaxID=349064 RepID=A0A1I0EXI6_THASX|nr:hypothetical protein [Thalassotalea agarivorans]SET49877.1 hypothetical protein SAMN05660429_01969 [Thalassotalea agarivorans]